MTITATIDEHEAVTLTYTRMNTTSNLGVPDAADFSDDLKSTFNPDQCDIYRDAYNVLVQPEGVTSKCIRIRSRSRGNTSPPWSISCAPNMPASRLWRELPLTRGTLHDRGLSVHGVWTMHIGLDTPPRIYVDWQEAPNKHEMTVAEHLVVARKIVHIEPGSRKPWME